MEVYDGLNHLKTINNPLMVPILWNKHARRPADPPGWLCGPALGVSAHDKLQRRKPGLRICGSSGAASEATRLLHGHMLQPAFFLKTGGVRYCNILVPLCFFYGQEDAEVEAFNRQFGLTISVQWQSTVKPKQDEPLPPQKHPRPSPLKTKSSVPQSPQSCILVPQGSSGSGRSPVLFVDWLWAATLTGPVEVSKLTN
ncbi:hypothetical protein Q8A73_012206 [Channa argus]|nr:hypothetical protein Q8A73_012206 [Channa argus]